MLKTIVTATYFVVVALLHITISPILFIVSKTKDRYKQSINNRFFNINPSFEKEDNIWFHAVSLGEVKSIENLLQMSDSSLSVITQAGFEEANKICDDVRFLPFETFLPFWVKRHKKLIVMEAELWLMMFMSAKMKGAETILLNARISDNSFDSYRRFSFFYKVLFSYIDKVYAQSEKDKERLELLGANNVKVIGNIKYLNKPKITKKLECSHKLITAGSTHEKEEELILNAFLRAKEKREEKITLAIVPRHKERFESIKNMIKERAKEEGFSYSFFSESETFEEDVVVVDAMGELVNIYNITDITILAGSFEKIGGHNPIEPAHFNNIVITGKHTFNQQTTFANIENFVEVENEDLANALERAIGGDIKKAAIVNKPDLDFVLKELF